ncbi:MAG: AI-2E family transporter [Nanoarchaeota archaeon]|nr:AI-2E family transporter [Nanoarchaeota archaeon]
MVVFAILLVLVFFILKPFINAILASFIIAYIFYPVYKLVKKVVKNESLASFLVSILVVLIFTIPLVFLANALSNQAVDIYAFTKVKLDELEGGAISEQQCGESNIICRISLILEKYLGDPVVNSQVQALTKNATVFLANAAANFVFSIPRYLISFFIMVFILFYLLKSGSNVMERIKGLLPLKKVHRKNIFEQLKDVTYAVIYGHILVAAIQALIGGIAFWIFGIKSPILWAVIMFFFALMPFLGTPVIWIPAVIFKFMASHPLQATGLLIIGLFISTIDNFIKPKIVSEKAKVHPVIVLLGVIGGLSLFGIIGIIIGPVILSIFMAFLDIYEEREIEAKG